MWYVYKYIFYIYEYLLKVDLNIEEWIKNKSATIRIIPHQARYHDLKQLRMYSSLLSKYCYILKTQDVIICFIALFPKKKQKRKV